MSSLAPVDDAALLRTYAAGGDAAAFAELVRRYADLVYATARRVTGSSATAEDVAQDCFLSLAMHCGGIRGSVGAWLHRATLNRSLEMIRSERARKQREVAAAEAAAAATAVAGQAAGATPDSAQLIAHVDEAIASLPDDLRIAVTEHFLCGRSQVELAAAMGVNQSTISRRIDAGLKRLRERLSARGVTAVAMGALPMFFSDMMRGAGGGAAAAPISVRAALIKIGLAGVRTTSSAARGTSALTKAAAALLLSLVSAGGLIALALWQAPPARPTRQVVVPAGATTASTRESDDEEDDEDEDEDHKGVDDDDDDDDPQPR